MTAFVKSHGLGNDYLVLVDGALPFVLTPPRIRRLCHRSLGVGSDGILLLTAARDGANVGLRILNPDGSEAEKSGNGLRIFAKFLFEHGHVTTPAFRVWTPGGVVGCECRVAAARVTAVAVEMGHASFTAADIPFTGVTGDAVDVPLALADRTLRITALTVGNPHCVVFCDRIDEADTRGQGAAIERHVSFPHRTNVQFARVTGRHAVAIEIWERGAGYTLASGSSSCAAAAAAVRTGRCDPGRITVTMPGGTLQVEVRTDWSLRLEGPVEEICSGTLSQDLLETLSAL